ncbi:MULTISPECIES: BrnA antitoxin family protein [Methylobacteriaceae]|uniref:BrnA antitoxin of type II toxin-antitoxin system n=1 Tax=Methylobacterium radiotolerans TaxID=31998 RepID=A0ABU7TGQ1_9HYPH
MAIDRTRRPSDPRQAAEAAFRAVTTKKAPEAAPAAPRAPLVPGARETVSLRIDRAVLEHFQKDGPGWQDRINAALKAAAGL